MYDFSGYATKNDIECGDGRIIRRDAFKDNDRTTGPLVWQHLHNTPSNILGHADLENRDDGVYAYCTFNDSPEAMRAKQDVQHGDITSMSIYANRLRQNGPNVVHGLIREVSLVVAGCNPGALIDPLSIAHDDGTYTDLYDEAYIFSGEDILVHSDTDTDDEDDSDDSNGSAEDGKMANSDKTVQDVIDSMTEEQKQVMYFMIGQALEGSSSGSGSGGEVSHADMGDDATVQDVIDSMTEEQKKVLYFMVGQALENAGGGDEVEHYDAYSDDMYHDDMYDDGYYTEDDMKYNVFEDEIYDDQLTHDDIAGIFMDAQHGTNGSLKDAFLAHGVENLEILYPEAKTVVAYPELISRDMAWVTKIWDGVKKTPFARIKTVAANITAYEARARGYVKGDQKVEEVLDLLARTTTPQTVYKLQKIDRDDVIDITTIDIVAWMKVEMRTMLNEEIARAILVGDDRPSSDPSYIKPDNIRPIYQDDDLYTIHEAVTIAANATFNDIADTIIETAVLARKNYKGSGTPTMYASTDIITRMLLAKDTLGHRMYRNESELASALRVKEIVEVPIFDGVKRTATISTTNEQGVTTSTSEERKLLAIIVNLTDYNMGADKGGAVNLFDDFDLNFNKYEYLIETRCSGALIRPYAAIAIETTSDLPFTFGTISGTYEGSKTQKARAASGATGNTGA